MNRYIVKWGESELTVEADNEADAWSKFVDQSELATKHPHLHERKVVEVAAKASEQPEVASQDVVSPVADETAELAIDNIGRMRSAEKLQEIIATDKRSTVVHAAQRRLTEI